ncbi:MAG TPA: hypothetical protein VD866_06150 [Urbifossiella sp.]|nr:hypothetical protein [Urbifossiella sp.]
MPAVDIPFPNVHPRVGLRVKTIDPSEALVRPADTFRPAAYGVLVYWPRAYAGWLKVEAEADTGTTVSRFSPQPPDLQAVLDKHNAGRLAMSQEVLTQKWVFENAFLVGSVVAPAGIRLTFRVDTNHEAFVRFVADVDADEKPVELTVLYFDGSADAPDDQPVRLLLQPATPVPAAKALLGVDLGNTSTTAALLDPFARDGRGLATPTRLIPMLTTRLVHGYRGGVVGTTDPNGSPITSELKFDLFRTFVPPGTAVPTNRLFPDLANYTDDRPNAVDYAAGELARSSAAAARSVVIGAKRMASIRPLPPVAGNAGRYPTHKVSAPHRVVYDPPRPDEPVPAERPAVMEVDTRAPLELLACRVFQHFREAVRGWPAKVALTYPTTYSRAEYLALRRAVQLGWLRMQAAGQGSGYGDLPADAELARRVRQLQRVAREKPGLDSQADDPVVHLLIDEASAAAFFHLYRRIFEQINGGLNGFRYLYEHGLTMLLYDCGGGTTDIALVRAEVTGDEGRTLRITVLRRSGVRTFGGDDITRQVCRLVKAKIAQVVAAHRRRTPVDPPRLPTRPPTDDRAWLKLADDLEKFIQDTAAADRQDELVPTRFDSGQTPEEDRRAAALALWRTGEQMKHDLSADEPSPKLPKEQRDRFVRGEARLPVWTWTRDLNALTKAILPAAVEDEVRLKRKLDEITVSRTEVDALIYRPVMRSIANCNRLIQSVLEGADGPAREVQWVVASGNAVRYPLLPRLLKERLAVAFLDAPDREPDGRETDLGTRRFTFDPDNAKDATAKGAVLALAAMEGQAQQIDPQFDSDLHNLLPFNVGYHDLRVNAVKVLYAEHTRYDALKARKPEVIPLPDVSKAGPAANRIILMRQFPGDEGFHNFLAFEFPGGIQGAKLEIRYDDENPFEFVVTDERGTEGVPTDLTAGDTYAAPAQRGDI